MVCFSAGSCTPFLITLTPMETPSVSQLISTTASFSIIYGLAVNGGVSFPLHHLSTTISLSGIEDISPTSFN